MQKLKSKSLFNRAKSVIPGGVNSPVRTFQGVGGSPLFIQSAKGSLLYDVDGNKYIDYIGSWGPMIFGHAWEPVIEAVSKQVEQSSSFGLATEKEIELAELVTSMVPGIQKVRLVNSGTEACMTALRIARAATQRQKLIKFEGCYHGHADPFLVKAGSGVSSLSESSSAGVEKKGIPNTLVATYNDLNSVQELIDEFPEEIAAIIVEPVAGNMGCIPPKKGFLEGLRQIASKNGMILIFDEVMTGFRLSPGGAQQKFGVEADLVTFGKIIGGGFPVGAVAGKSGLMDLLAPTGPVYQAGTLSGNPVATTAGITVLEELKRHPEVYEKLNAQTKKLKKGLKELFARFEISTSIHQSGSMISVFFSESDIQNFNDVRQSDITFFSEFFGGLLQQGIHLPPSAYESWFLATTHADEFIDQTLTATQNFLEERNGKENLNSRNRVAGIPAG